MTNPGEHHRKCDRGRRRTRREWLGDPVKNLKKKTSSKVFSAIRRLWVTLAHRGSLNRGV